MFSLIPTKWLLPVVAIGAFLLALWWYYTNTQQQINQLTAENAELHVVNDQYAEEIQALDEHNDKIETQVQELLEGMQESQREVDDLRDKLIKHDLEELARKKPGLVEKRINDGTEKVIDEINDITNS